MQGCKLCICQKKITPWESDSPYVSQGIFLSFMEPQCPLPYSQNPIISPNPEYNWCPCFRDMSVCLSQFHSVLPPSLHNNLSNFVSFYLLHASYMSPIYCYCMFNNAIIFWTVVLMTLCMLHHSPYYWVSSASTLTLWRLTTSIGLYRTANL